MIQMGRGSKEKTEKKMIEIKNLNQAVPFDELKKIYKIKIIKS